MSWWIIKHTLVGWGSTLFIESFGVGLLVRFDKHHRRCVGLVGKSGANFREFTPRLGIVDHGSIILGLKKILWNSLSVGWSFIPSYDMEDQYLFWQMAFPWMTLFYVRSAHLFFLLSEDYLRRHWTWMTIMDEDYLLWITIMFIILSLSL